jgi:K+-sensing histidine kinase KdpD
VTNLLSNAIKFSPKGSTVVLDVAQQRDSVKVSVIDQGAGVPISERDMIFEKFKQSKHSTSSIKGTGLGLAICKLIVDAHDGHIGIASNSPTGSIFFMEIPAYQESRKGT